MRRTTLMPAAILSPWFLPAAVCVITYLVFTLLLMGFMERPLVRALGVLLPHMQFLIVAVAIWALVASRRVLDPSTGAGFAIAALGLLLRLLLILESIVQMRFAREGVFGAPLTDLHVAADLLGTFAYFFGLTMVATSTLLAWRRSSRDYSAGPTSTSNAPIVRT